MDHQLIYEKIIKKAKSEFRIKHNGIYYEEHHIIPTCLHGSDEPDNKVLLTAKEHYLAHKLLTFIYPNNRKIILAYHYMMHVSNKNNFKIKISAGDYAYLKELISKNGLSEEAKLKVSIFNKGKIVSNETKEKHRIAQLGEKNSMFGKPAWEAINNIRKTCEYCGIETNIGNYGRWHGKRCKHNI